MDGEMSFQRKESFEETEWTTELLRIVLMRKTIRMVLDFGKVRNSNFKELGMMGNVFIVWML